MFLLYTSLTFECPLLSVILKCSFPWTDMRPVQLSQIMAPHCHIQSPYSRTTQSSSKYWGKSYAVLSKSILLCWPYVFHVACWPWVEYTCMLLVFVSAPSLLCEFLGLMSLSCTSILGYWPCFYFLSLLMCKFKFSWILSSILDILYSLWFSGMFYTVFTCFAEILLSTQQFGFLFKISVFMVNPC